MSRQYKRKDRFYEQAKVEGYRSRASFKLLELDKRFHLFRAGRRVVDLGCWPGGWSQVAAELVGRTGMVVGVDLKAVEPLKSEELQIQRKQHGFAIPMFVKGDVHSLETQETIRSLLHGEYCDLLISDLSAPLTGIKERDVAQAADTLELVFKCADMFCRDGATVVAKTFPSPDTDLIIKRFIPKFAKLNRVTLDATRKSSNEYYVVGTDFHRGWQIGAL